MQEQDKEKLQSLKAQLPVPPVTKASWSVYVDESYWGPDFHNRMVTSFYAIDDEKQKALHQKYTERIISRNPDIEIKSSRVSDWLNIEAIKASKGFKAIYGFCESNHEAIANDNSVPDTLALAYLIETYLFPVEYILRELKERVTLPKLQVKIYIDSRPNLEPSSGFSLMAPYFLTYLENKYSDKNLQIELSWQTLDSEHSIGIQVADMLCGAYRKQKTYELVEPAVKMLPITYFKKVCPDDYHYDQELMAIYGLLAIYNQAKITIKGSELSAVATHLPEILDDFRGYIKFMQRQTIESQDQLLTQLKTNYDQLFSHLDNIDRPGRLSNLNVVLGDLGRYRHLSVNFTVNEEKAAIADLNSVWVKLPKYKEYVKKAKSGQLG